MAELIMSAKERQHLKGEAHRLNPVVLMGAEGLTDAVVQEVDRALTAHGLVKIRTPGDDRAEREQIFADLAERLSAARVQAIGKVLVLFRPQPDDASGQSAAKAATAPARSPKAPARVPKKRAAADTPQRGKPGRSEIRGTSRTTAPRRTGGRAR
jgi:putative YhbY family RNA-binding protein